MSENIYPVGALSALLVVRRALTKRHPALRGKRWKIAKSAIRKESWYLRRQIGNRNWRAVRNSFNGYLAEHDGHPHDCGRGWTKAAASRRAARLCAASGADS